MRSVVLASYQGARFIGAQLESILGQLAADDEIIVSDDASTDDTLAVVGGFDDPRIRILPNRIRAGYLENFERAIAVARGDLIFFSDQDDIWLPRKVPLMSTALQRKLCVVSDAVVVDENLNRLHDSYFEFRRASHFTFLATFLRPRFIGAAMACRKPFLEALLPFPKNVPHDFWISLNALAATQLEVIPEPLILYRRHAATASTSATLVKRPAMTILMERFRTAAGLVTHRIRAGKRPTSIE